MRPLVMQTRMIKTTIITYFVSHPLAKEKDAKLHNTKFKLAMLGATILC